ncbi:TPA: PBECR4 domain-containing protein [Streptococcus suis]
MAQFTKDDAKAMSILDVAQSLGMEMKQNSSQEWYWVEHDSFKINTRKNRFDWYSRDIHGDVINLVETIKEVDYKQAMHYLRTGEFPKAEMTQQVKEPFRYILGRFEQPFVEARAYLKEVRGLSDDTINFFGQAGVLAQANKKAPDDYLEPVVVFKSLDKQGDVIGASLQGIVPNKERYEGKGYLKQIAYNSGGLSGMSVDIGTPKRLVFAEAPIDLMSYYEANKGNLSDVRLVAMDGLKAGTVSRYTMELLAELQGKFDYKPDLNKVGEALEKLAKVTTFFQDGKNSDLITLAVDNDKAGRDFIERLQAKGIPVQPELPPLPEGAIKMDWNDHLKSQKAGMVLEDSIPRDNSRLAQAERKLERLNSELVEKADRVYAHTRQANGQPMNDKRGGAAFFRKQDQLEGTVFTKLDEIKKQEERVEKLRHQKELKERGFNKQGNGLVMSVANIPRIKEAIERFERGEPGFTRATINRYRKELIKLEAMKERLETTRISPGAQHLIDEGLVSQWDKQPTLYFIKGLRKVAFELTDSGEFQVSAKYQPKTSEEIDKVEELLSNIQANEKVQELLDQVEELGQTAYFWITEEDLEQPEEIVSQLDNWFSSEKVDATYQSDLFELVAGDYTYMIEFKDGGISLQNMEDYSQYIYNRIEELGLETVIAELESVIHDFNQVKNSITEGMNKELEALSATLTRDTELLDQQTTRNNEKEQNMTLEHETENLAQATEPRFELDFSEIGSPEQPITNLDELQNWILQQFNSRYTDEGYFKTYLQVYSFDEQGQEVAQQIRFDVGHGQSDFNPRREHIRDYLVNNGYIRLRNEIKERRQSEFIPTLLQEIQKDPEQTQEQTKKETSNVEVRSNAGEFHRTSDFSGDIISPRTASQPVVNESQPDFPVIAQLQFTTKGIYVSNRKPDHSVIDEKSLRRLNRFAPTLQSTAQWYLNELADSKISYFFSTPTGETDLVEVTFNKRNFAHLAGVSPVGRTMEEAVDDFARGFGDYDNIQISHALKDKMKVLPLLPEIIETGSFIFNDVSVIEKLDNLDMSKAINPNESELLVLFKNIEDEGLIPASLMRVKGDLSSNLRQIDRQEVLGIYRERNGVIEELDINKEYVKDGGKEFMTILQNRQLEPVITQEEPSLQERFTSVLDGVKELGYDLFKDRNEEEFKLFHQLYEQNHNDLNQTVLVALKQGLVDTNSNFFVEWKDDFLYQEKGISSVDVMNGKLTKEEYDAQVSTLIEEKLQLQQSLSELLESKDNQALFNHLKEGMKEYTNTDKYKQFLQAISKFHDYSIYNVHMMLLQKPDISLVASYQRWKTDFDRQVQKGEKGIKIWVPMTFKAKDRNGQPVLDENGQEKTITRFKLGTVFDVSQTAGKELPKPVYNLESNVPDYQNIYRAARHVSQENGVKISFQPIDSGANGYYHIEKKEILIADKKMSEAQILKTLFHEMAHSELHHFDDGYSSSERELQAESIAYVVANHYGIDTSEYSFGYLHNWSLDKQGYEDLENQLKVVQAESKSLINRIDKSLELVKNKSLTTNKLQSKIAQVKQKQEQEKQLKSSEVKQEKSKKQQPTPKEL